MIEYEYRIVTNGFKYRVQHRLVINDFRLWWSDIKDVVDSDDMAVLYEPVTFSSQNEAEEYIDDLRVKCAKYRPMTISDRQPE